MSVNNEELAASDIRMRRGWIATAVILVILLVDQIVKFWVKTNFYLGEDLEITSWWHLKFIENNGMAFGMELGSKIALTMGRIAAVALFIWFISRLIRIKNVRMGFLITCALITAGAAGNIFDCVFYGEIFNNPMPPEVATLFPEGGGYSTWFEGRVVDMMYFPLFDFYWPEWMPIVGGRYFEFFQYIFNIADASICVGVFMLILFYSNEVSESFLRISDSLKGKHGKSADSK